MNPQFSNLAWHANQGIYAKIMQHPFNHELLNGTLDQGKFSYYIEQDSIYLKAFSKTLAIIASKLPTSDLITQFIDFSKGAIVAEQDGVHEYFKKRLQLRPSSKISLACMGYTSYLLRCVAIETVEVAIAAVVPCFWVYNCVGKYFADNSTPNNLYQRWIDTYASDDFSAGVNAILKIVNNCYLNANDSTRQLMLKAFATSMVWEYRFWDDAYKFNHFNLSLQLD